MSDEQIVRSYYLVYGDTEYWLWPDAADELKAAARRIVAEGTSDFVTVRTTDGEEWELLLSPYSALAFRASGDD